MKLVLQKYKDGGKPDPFERYLLDLNDDNDDLIEKRMDEVLRWWNNNKTLPPPIGPIITSLVKDHNRMIAELADRDARRELAAALGQERDRADARRLKPVEDALKGLHAEHGGIPDESRPLVVDIGRLAGLTEQEINGYIDTVMKRHGWVRVAVAASSSVDPLPDGVAKQIRQQLRRFQDTRAQEMSNDQPVRSLFEALGLEFDADPFTCKAGTDALDSLIRSSVKSSSDFAAASRNVIEAARGNLSDDQSISRYRATIVNEVIAHLELAFRTAAIDGSIDAKENQSLLLAAAAEGLPNRYAREAVDGLFRRSAESGRVVQRESGERVTLILCASCRTPDSLESGHKQCLSCGDPLYRVCDNCQSDVPRGDAVCRACGHSMLAALQLDAEVRQARQALHTSRPAFALHRLGFALQLEPSSTAAQSLKAEADSAVSVAAQKWQSVALSVSKANLYSARSTLRTLADEAIDVEGPNGDTPAEALARLQGELRAVEDRIAGARGLADPVQREHIFAEVLTQVSDSDEAKRELARIPPDAPTQVQTELLASGIQIMWSASRSPGVTSYSVIRGDRQAPLAPTQGIQVTETTSTSAVDSDAQAGAVITYSVFAIRAGVASPPASSAPRTVSHEAIDVTSTVDSGEVRIGWRLPTPTAIVEVERRSDDGRVVTLSAGPDGLVDAGLKNGAAYRYTVRLRYGDVVTNGITLVATPAEPPRVVTLSGLEAVADGVAIRWTPPPAGTVTICRSPVALDLTPGAEIRRDLLAKLGHLLPASGGKATDAAATDGCWYTPITVSGDRAVVGSGLRWSDIPAVTDVKAQENGSEVKVSWSWPTDVKHVVVLWREGGAPEGVDDPAAHSQHVARAVHQEVNGGVFRIARERPQEPLRLAVYGAQMRDGELIVGARLAPSSRTSVDAAHSKATILYEVKVNRGLRGKSLELKLVGADRYPEVVLVAKPGDIIPLAADDGQPVARVGGAGAGQQITVPLGALPPVRPLAIRAFLAADSSRSSFILKEPADLTSLVLR
jgi:hypothetical protein